MKLNDELIELINKEINDGYICVNKHPEYNLFIYKYSTNAVLEMHWNRATMLCRGIVLDSDYNVIAWPMRKFFNYEEMNQEDAIDIMSVPFQVTEKVDGSLGILVHYNNEFFFTTQGSFTSDQAIWATKFLNEKYSKYLDKFDCDKYTYLFEIVYPENKIVVDYGDFADLVFLARINKETGEDEMLEDDIEERMKPFLVTKRFRDLENKDFSTIKNLNLDNKEGFVIHSTKGRLKIKFEKYFELHRILTNLTEKTIWKAMMQGNDEVTELRRKIPEELWEWFDNIVNDFNERVMNIKDECFEELSILHCALGENYSRKDFALANLSRNKDKKSGFIFNLEYGKDIYKEILKTLEPKEIL